MIKPEQVPDASVEALLATLHGKPGLPYREAIAAALSAWPGMENVGPDPDSSKALKWIILPLPQEASDE